MNKIIEFNSFSFSENTFYSISGANNSGKTTFIRLLQKELYSDSIIVNKKNINNYTINELNNIIRGVIPLEIDFLSNTLIEELTTRNNNMELQDYLLKGLKIKSISKNKFNELSKREIVLSQIVIALSYKPQVLLLDSISNYLSNTDMKNLYKLLNDYRSKYNLTVITTTNKLEDTLYSDYLYIIENNEVFLEGKPLEVLEKDNILNKLGLSIPFMIDLSVKLRDYNLIDNIELDKDRMVDILWK